MPKDLENLFNAPWLRISRDLERQTEYLRHVGDLPVGQQDRRIAATGIRHGYAIVTQNIQDFRPTGVRCEDWTVNADL